jgi:hypothetical protein
MFSPKEKRSWQGSRSWVYLFSQCKENMIETHELFTSLSKTNSNMHMQLGTNAKCCVKGVGTVTFQLEAGGSLEVEDVFLSVSTMEDSGYAISFQDGWVCWK